MSKERLMKKCRYKTAPWQTIGVHSMLISICIMVVATAVFAKNTASPSKPTEQEKPIHIISDRLEADNESNVAEFIGNVRATQGTTVITSDRLKVYYKGSADQIEAAGPGEESIQKIVSTGHVVIYFDNRVAKAENAVYIAESRILILTGPKSTLTSGKNIVTGEKITLYRNDGKIHVESGRDGRVEATFFSTGKGLE